VVPRDRHPDQKIDRCQRIRVGHKRQMDEIFDRARAELRADAIVGVSRVGFRRMLRNVDAQVS
jgi:hypothetical protein